MIAEKIRNELVLALARRAELDEQINRARCMLQALSLKEKADGEEARKAAAGTAGSPDRE